jgi:hypothetical protein
MATSAKSLHSISGLDEGGPKLGGGTGDVVVSAMEMFQQQTTLVSAALSKGNVDWKVWHGLGFPKDEAP